MTDSSEPIHSGHFMTSNPHRENANDDDEDVEVFTSIILKGNHFFLKVDVVDVDDNGGSTAICEKNYIQVYIVIFEDVLLEGVCKELCFKYYR